MGFHEQNLNLIGPETLLFGPWSPAVGGRAPRFRCDYPFGGRHLPFGKHPPHIPRFFLHNLGRPGGPGFGEKKKIRFFFCLSVPFAPGRPNPPLPLIRHGAKPLFFHAALGFGPPWATGPRGPHVRGGGLSRSWAAN